jgi:hypothetical protein
MNIRYLFVSCIAATIVTAVLLGSAQATVLYEQSPVGAYNTGAVGSAVGGNAGFDNFSLADASTVTSISWIGRFSAPGDQFRVGFYESDGQAFPFTEPLTTPFFELTSAVDGVLNPLDPIGFARDYTLDLGAGVSLDADTNYFVSIQNADSSFWQWQNDGFGIAFVRFPSGSGTLFNGTLFFTLEGEVNDGSPTVALAGPPAAAILALGMIGISTIRRRNNLSNRSFLRRITG